MVHHQKADGQEDHADVRLDEEVDARLDDIAFPALEDDEEETAEGHQFPGDEEGDGMLRERQQNHRREGQQVPENVQPEFLSVFFIGFKIVSPIESTGGENQRDDGDEPPRKPVGGGKQTQKGHF